ncbi:MAG: hypothetical protein JWN30_2485, partial [Bacilli bacterium]|nr:hypothetical protein [Bacilli bacterium]
QFKMKGHQDRIYGPRGGAEGGFNNNTKKITLYEEDQVEEISLEAYSSLHKEQFDLFVNALNEGKPAPVSFQAGRDVLAVTLAIFKSIETGQIIDFPAFYKEIAQ